MRWHVFHLWLCWCWKDFYIEEDISFGIVFTWWYCLNRNIKWLASLLLLRGITTHSKFAIPVPTFENSTCNIHQGSELAELLSSKTNNMGWNTTNDTQNCCFETLHKSLRDITSYSNNGNSLFGGIVVIFGGDFRQILLVIPRGCRSDIINAKVNSSYLWGNIVMC